ncbi:Maf family protein [Bacillus andreraoultii]|uniref:Maf family protein n=1 Tax=Bacillus andreraoultii TaxID=1499685 RepID=UPI00053A394F|nr:Maf family protein [Bacillus andreraoultii]
MARLILASSSPRRRDILKQLVTSFEIISSNVDESVDKNLPPEEIVMNLAKRKASSVANNQQDAFIIGADTIVVFKNQILGKPADYDEAKQMLTTLSGNTHSVYTGTCIINGNDKRVFYEKADVTFWELTEEEIDRYIRTGEPLDKAGSYGIQGYGATLVKSIHGDFYAVVGLPIAKLYHTLKEMKFPFKKL